MSRLALLLSACLLCSGCATTTQFVRPPEDKLACSDEPTRPVGEGEVYIDAEGRERRAVTDGENQVYLSSLRVAGQSCRADVNWLRAWFDSLDD